MGTPFSMMPTIISLPRAFRGLHNTTPPVRTQTEIDLLLKNLKQTPAHTAASVSQAVNGLLDP